MHGTGESTRAHEVEASRRIRRSWSAVAVLAILIILAALTPSPFVIEEPGPVVDALGTAPSADGDIEVVEISGTETFETDGSLNILSISIIGSPRNPIRWLTLAGALFNPNQVITPASQYYPDGLDVDERTRRNAVLMEQSQVAASAAALRALGKPVAAELRVESVVDGGPADGVLRTGDVIREVNGDPLSGASELRSLVAEYGHAGAVSLGIVRDGTPQSVRIAPRVFPETGSADPLLGIIVATELEFPFDISLQLEEIGGPSAGLVFALAVYDELTPGALTGGLTVSGTGTIDDAGAVGAIGGLPLKIIGAAEAGSDLMLIPMENCADLPGRLPDGMVIAPVATLDEAVSVTEAVANGEPVPGIERCGR